MWMQSTSSSQKGWHWSLGGVVESCEGRLVFTMTGGHHRHSLCRRQGCLHPAIYVTIPHSFQCSTSTFRSRTKFLFTYGQKQFLYCFSILNMQNFPGLLLLGKLKKISTFLSKTLPRVFHHFRWQCHAIWITNSVHFYHSQLELHIYSNSSMNSIST